MIRAVAPCLATCLAVSCASPKTSNRFSADWFEFERKPGIAAYASSFLVFEKVPGVVQQAIDGAIAKANAQPDVIGKYRSDEVTFEKTVRDLDDLNFEFSLTAKRVYLLKKTSENPDLRTATTEAIKKFDEWAAGLECREDILSRGPGLC